MPEHDDPLALAARPGARRPISDILVPASEGGGAPMQAALAGHHPALSPAAVLHLQRTAGNAGVASLLEADPDEQGSGHEGHGHTEQRSPVLDIVGSGGGSGLDADTRSLMETRIGHDFGDVRVHTDAAASDSAKAVNAHAYTVGTDVVFQSGAYTPGTESGQRMLAHELTHVVQQKAGPVDGSPAAGGIRISDPSDRFEREADAVAERVMTAPASAAGATAGGPTAESPAIQRAESGEEETEDVQAFSVQRQEEMEEEGEA